MILKRIKTLWRSLRFYVVADPADNSITLSKRLFRHIRDNADAGGEASVFVFRIPQNAAFGFMVNHGIDKPTQLCRIQYNGRYRCVGFETLCPSVGRIFFEYGLPPFRQAKLSVSVCRTPQGRVYYQIDVPSIKQVNKCKAFSGIQGKRI